jgi:acetylglutamate kinase
MMPFLAPIGLDEAALAEGGEGGDAAGAADPAGMAALLNINADTVAGEVAAALGAARLVFLTDVPGVKDGAGAVAAALDRETCARLIESGAIGGGMIPKVEACLRAAAAGAVAEIVDGREPGALARVLSGTAGGTRVG